MTKRFLFVFLVLVLAVASAKTYSITLFQPSIVAGTELKAGDYQLALNEKAGKVVLKNGAQKVESAVKVENAERKFSSTSVRYADNNGKYRVREIRLGGTKLKLVFD